MTCSFNKIISALSIVILISISTVSFAQDRPEEKLGWKLGAQAYSFRLFTFSEAIEKADSCNLIYIEAFTGQTIGGGIEGMMDFNMHAENSKKI